MSHCSSSWRSFRVFANQEQLISRGSKKKLPRFPSCAVALAGGVCHERHNGFLGCSIETWQGVGAARKAEWLMKNHALWSPKRWGSTSSCLGRFVGGPPQRSDSKANFRPIPDLKVQHGRRAYGRAAMNHQIDLSSRMFLWRTK